MFKDVVEPPMFVNYLTDGILLILAVLGYEEQLTTIRLPQSGGAAAYDSIRGCSA